MNVLHHNLLFSSHVVMALLTSFIFILASIWFILFLVKKFFKKHQALSLPPGPMGMPILGSLPFLQPEVHSYFASLAKTYGPIFSLRLGNKLAIVISNPSLAREVLKDKDIIFANRDVPIAAKLSFYGGSDILWRPYGAEWGMLRKLFSRNMFSGPMVDFVSVVRRNEVRRMVNDLWVKRMSLVNVREVIFMTVLNSMTNILWGGGESERVEKSLGTEFHLFLEEIVTLLERPNISDIFPSLAYFDLQGLQKKMKMIAKKFDKVFECMIDEGMRHANNDRIDFLKVLLNLRKEGRLTTIHVKALLMDMLLGGTNTTTYTIEFALAEMMNNPCIMKTAQKELEEVVGAYNMVEELHIPKLTYLHAIMKETLRLHTTGPLLVPHCSSESSTIGGYTIPKGTRVFINVWAIHRDPSIWENPLTFNPERFMITEWNYTGNDFNYFPFGSGRRICPGIHLAEKMFVFLLASLIHSFEWNVFNGEKVNIEEKFGLAIKLKESLLAIPVPRLSNQALYE